MRRLIARPLVLVVFFVALASIILALIIMRERGGIDAGGDNEEVRAARERTHSLDDVASADFVSVFVYQPDGSVASYMAGGSTDQFGAFVDAVREAVASHVEQDESFSDLLVFSFSDRSTLELPYSRSRNLLIYNEGAYEPAADLGPIIADVKARFGE